MADITLGYAWQWILAAAAALVAIAKAFDIIRGSFKKLYPGVEEINGIKAKVSKLEKEYEEAREFETVMCRVMLAQLNHELSGNDVVKLKEARDDLNKYLTER